MRVLLREGVGVGKGEAFSLLVLGVGCVRLLRRVWWVLGERWVELVRSCMRLVTYVSSPLEITYLRWDRESNSSLCWVCVRVGMRPWYMMVRLMRIMCKPHVHPSVCWGVLWIWMIGASCLRIRGHIYNPVYHWRSVLCVMLIAGGGLRLRES